MSSIPNWKPFKIFSIVNGVGPKSFSREATFPSIIRKSNSFLKNKNFNLTAAYNAPKRAAYNDPLTWIPLASAVKVNIASIIPFSSAFTPAETLAKGNPTLIPPNILIDTSPCPIKVAERISKVEKSGKKCGSVLNPVTISADALAPKPISLLISMYTPGTPAGRSIAGGSKEKLSSKKVKAPLASISYPSSPSRTPWALIV